MSSSRSLERARRHQPWGVLFAKEVRGLLAGKAYWAMLLLLCPLVGYGFIEAVSLFAEASRSAQGFPELARGMRPLDGVLVPTFGAFYLATTLLFPFVAIRMLGSEKLSGSLKILLQMPFRPIGLVGMKLAALMIGLTGAAIPGLTAIIIWLGVGGHAYWPELLNLLMGHLLYALVVAGIGFFAAAVTDGSATAAIVALACTTGSWVLDFAAAGHKGWLQRLSILSLTATLRTFEQGLWSLPATVTALIVASALLALTAVWLPPGIPIRSKVGASAVVAIVATTLIVAAQRASVYVDVTEDRRNSFSPADERALREMTGRLVIQIHLSPDDPRLADLDSNILSKLRRLVARLTVTYADGGRTGAAGAAHDSNYGLIVYEYAGRRDASRSTSEEEVLPLLHGLAGRRVTPDAIPEYPGYPVVADVRNVGGAWFYLALPGVVAVALWLSQRPPKPILGGKT